MEEPFFLRKKEVRVTRLADDRYRLDGEMRNDFHHLMEVVTDIGRAAFQIHMANLRGRALENPDLAKVLGQPLEKRKFVLVAMPQLADSCWVFNTGNDERFEKQWREQP